MNAKAKALGEQARELSPQDRGFTGLSRVGVC